jgi:hypothetical protein
MVFMIFALFGWWLLAVFAFTTASVGGFFEANRRGFIVMIRAFIDRLMLVE